MIRIPRQPLDPGCDLAKKGPGELTALIAQASLTGAAFDPEHKSSVYGSCKPDLLTMQHVKCCYCESEYLTATQHGDVEHYRPKKGVAEAPSHLGYWWLGYDWDNLLLSCAKCNQKPAKGTRFPLRDETRRAYDPMDPLEAEEPLLLHPCLDEPEEHIRFRAERAIGVTERGSATIEICQLNRPELMRLRARSYQRAKRVYQSLLRLAPLQERAALGELMTSWNEEWDELRESMLSRSSPYLAMIRCGFRDEFKY